MIQLFKKIRRKLLVEKRLSNYIIYAIGEVLLVVIGIVLAIQFSNWNDKRSEIKKEIWYLDNIADDMFYQKDGLLDLKTSFEETLEVSKDLLLAYSKTKSYGTQKYMEVNNLNQHCINSIFTKYVEEANRFNTEQREESSGGIFMPEAQALLQQYKSQLDRFQSAYPEKGLITQDNYSSGEHIILIYLASFGAEISAS